MNDRITLSHGNGGKPTWDLITGVFGKYFKPNPDKPHNDAAELTLAGPRIAFTTDSFVVNPIFFPGGDIGRLAVCGTVNDLLTSGAVPAYLSCAFILEEGFPIADLERVVAGMADTAAECGVGIVTGDTKVVQRGAADGLFINTTGIGTLREGVDLSANRIRPGDGVIVTGTLGEHGCAIMLARGGFGMETDIHSDCAPLRSLLEPVLDSGMALHAMRDPSRGGLAATLNELASQSGTCIELREDAIPVKDQVRGVCGILGLDPLYLANEGKMVIVAPRESCDGVIGLLNRHPLGGDARLIGHATDSPGGRVLLRTALGTRIIDMPVLDQIPRIC